MFLFLLFRRNGMSPQAVTSLGELGVLTVLKH